MEKAEKTVDTAEKLCYYSFVKRKQYGFPSHPAVSGISPGLATRAAV
jgi:hypothetical protein